MEQIVAQNKAELEQRDWSFQSEALPSSADIYPYKIRLATNLRESPENPTARDSVRVPVLLHIEGNAPVTEGLTIRICHKGRGKRRPLIDPLDRSKGRKTIKVSGSWRIPSSKATEFEYAYPKLRSVIDIFDPYSSWANSDERIYRMSLVPVENRANVYQAQAAHSTGHKEDIAWIDILCGYCREIVSDSPNVKLKHAAYLNVAAFKDVEGWKVRRAHLKDIGFALFDGEKQISEILPVTINLSPLVNEPVHYGGAPIVSGK